MNVADHLNAAGMSEGAATEKAAAFAKLARHLPAFDFEPMRWFVPGRIEVLGKHTDYAGGRSLLCTAERGFCVAAVRRADSIVRINDVGRHKTAEFPLSPNVEIPPYGWTTYPTVVARRLARNFAGAVRGAEIVLASDLPSAAGMSSSSALVTAIFAVLSAVNDLPQHTEYIGNIATLEDLAGYLGCIENGQSYKALSGDAGVGTFGGSEDHTAILTSQPGHLKQYSFCPVRIERSVRVPDDCVFVIGVSGVVADKTGTAKELYNRASLSVRAIVDIWKAATGSNPPSLAAAATSSPDAPGLIRDAIRHAISNATEQRELLNRFEQFWLESEVIMPKAGDALTLWDLTAFGQLVDQSQTATEELLGNQVPETAWLAREARNLGAIAASAFGAGFGGSVWALVRRKGADEFLRSWQRSYQLSSHQAARNGLFFPTVAGPPLVHI
jgi:galactokinase